jgi:homoserine kinase type II
MAVYTDISDEELDRFLSQYDIGQLLSFAGIAEGVENSNFLLRTDQANYILTLYEKRVDKNELPFFIGLMQHLADKGLNCPLPIATNSGDTLSVCAGRPAAIVSFLNGTSARYPNAKKCFALGQALANLHQKADGMTLQRQNSLGPQDWQPLLDSIDIEPDDLPHSLTADAAKILPEILAAWPSDLPSGIIHADLFPNNVLFVGDELTGLIDFYFACSDFLAYDLAICLNSWCFEADGSFNITKSSAMLSGYQSVRTLTTDELDALPILSAGAAMRFFLTRLYDWINTPADAFVKPLNPMEYWAKLRFHRNAKSASAYGAGL